MAHLIDKDALILEIDRRIQFFTEEPGKSNSDIVIALFGLKSFLDTLEVKEVDLEKEFDNYTKNILACDVQFEPFTHLYNCAKHFFELGLKTQKGE